MIDQFDNATVGDIVATDIRSAAVFQAYGIDFCCEGRRTFFEACQHAAVDPHTVIDALRALPEVGSSDDDVMHWPLDRVIDHVIDTHHTFIRQWAPVIADHSRS